MMMNGITIPHRPTEEYSATAVHSRADEVDSLLNAIQAQLIPFIRNADQEKEIHESKYDDQDVFKTCLVDSHTPSELQKLLPLDLPTNGLGSSGLLSILRPLLKFSVNTFAPGFLDKLYASTNAPGIASDLILSVLNTNVHVYQVSPVLSLVEKHVTKALAALFGLTGPRAGGINVQGGSASNTTSIVVARNTLYPDTKIYGNSHNGRQLVLFTSAHGHYSIEKAAQACGFGSAAVISISVDPNTGTMSPSALESAVESAKAAGMTPFYVNATAGTTVLGSFDPFSEIATIAHRNNMWFHIDGSWGGSFIFSEGLRSSLAGSELADSIAINPHKMMGVPVTCSFLLAKDLRQFHRANTLPAGYLFHGDDCIDPGNDSISASNGDLEDSWTEPNDLADLTLQCGRRGDSLKLFLSWQYYGTAGYASQVENAHSIASYLASLLADHPDVILVSENPPPCLQVCFYFSPGRRMVFGDSKGQLALPSSWRGPGEKQRALALGKQNSMVTERIAKALVAKGFMVDFAPALEGREAEGKFFRVVVNVQTGRGTVERLVREITTLGMRVRDELRQQAEAEGQGQRSMNGHVHGPVIRKKNPAERGHGPVVHV